MQAKVVERERPRRRTKRLAAEDSELLRVPHQEVGDNVHPDARSATASCGPGHGMHVAAGGP